MAVGFICLIFDEYNEVQGRLPNPLSENKKSRIVESGFLSLFRQNEMISPGLIILMI